MAANGISTLPTKEERQIAKLELAQIKRQLVGTPGYRELRYYDVDLLPTKYSGNNVVNTPHPSGLVQGRPWKTTPNIVSGLWRTIYDGYFNDNGSQGTRSEEAVAWFDTVGSGIVIQSTEVVDFSLPDANIYSLQYLGYFRAPQTALYTFYMESDDEAYFWVGDTAVTGYTASNAHIYSWAGHGEVASDPVSLTADQYYPIRLQYGNTGGPALLNFSWSNNL
ncbi:GLEYA adhesin domain containing protein [uncultured Caudovirales phage]|uniref:GLEYA adhesin domain containing protein n=1 Tax=uncultured Caudovirales phage TaxID=2100421 RepID=A0A6J5KS75_9CAUD|nr:GLEYA adhesin domain containing protein [uncultured Caudovirales phage]CAB5208558.1 GLEYA adhesin domain containing protein [uncultured Caudovirales phage]